MAFSQYDDMCMTLGMECPIGRMTPILKRGKEHAKAAQKSTSEQSEQIWQRKHRNPCLKNEQEILQVKLEKRACTKSSRSTTTPYPEAPPRELRRKLSPSGMISHLS